MKFQERDNDMIEIYSSIIQTVLAIAAMIISVIEIRKSNKEKSDLKMLKKIEKELVETTKGIKIDVFIDSISRLQIDEKILDNLDGVLDEYEKISKQIEVLYKQLLKDESSFPLSYGFERYINQFRKVCIKGKYIKNSLVDGRNYYVQRTKTLFDLSEKKMDENSHQNTMRLLREFILNKNELHYTIEQQREALYKNVPNAMNKTAADIIWEIYINYVGIEESLNDLVAILVETQELIEEMRIKYC